jgi:hypothetical protein
MSEFLLVMVETDSAMPLWCRTADNRLGNPEFCLKRLRKIIKFPSISS